MPRYAVTAQFLIDAANKDEAENVTQNAVEATAEHYETIDVTAEPEDDTDDEDEDEIDLTDEL